MNKAKLVELADEVLIDIDIDMKTVLRKELEKHIKYIEMVLREKKDELFCLNVEIKQQKEKGA